VKRILFAINNKSAEQKLSKLIKENGKDEQYQVVGTLVSNESITDFLSNKTTDILVYIEGLNGKEDGFDTHSCGGKRGFAACVSCADHGNICRIHIKFHRMISFH
jgi:hypothetical protein